MTGFEGVCGNSAVPTGLRAHFAKLPSAEPPQAMQGRHGLGTPASAGLSSFAPCGAGFVLPFTAANRCKGRDAIPEDPDDPVWRIHQSRTDLAGCRRRGGDRHSAFDTLEKGNSLALGPAA